LEFLKMIDRQTAASQAVAGKAIDKGP
jgi:hypothetical protein